MDLKEAKERILEVHRQVAKLDDEAILHGPRELIEPPFRALDELASAEVDPSLVPSLREDPELREALAGISRLRRLYGLRLEVEAALEVLGAQRPWDVVRNFVFYENYRRLARTEGEAAGLKEGDLVVMLGAGPLPMSLILLAELFGVKGLGIEREGRWAALAKGTIERLGLSGDLAVIRSDHRLLPHLRDYRLLIVAALAEPKGEIFDLLAEHLPPKALISHRLYEKGLRAILYEATPFQSPPALQEVARIPPHPPVNNTVVILRRKDDKPSS